MREGDDKMSEETRKRAKELVSQMTVEEKMSQMLYQSPAIERLGIPAYNWWNEALHGVARAGVATMFPQSIGLAATFDRELIQEIGDVVSTEGRAKFNEFSRRGDHGIYKGLTFWAPNVNIFRDPRWGRGHETYGEDPYLTGELGCAYIKGLQGPDPEHPKAAACAKHFAVHSGPEALRHQFDAQVSKHDLYDTYLYAFKRCVKDAKVEAVMGAYNRVNGKFIMRQSIILIGGGASSRVPRFSFSYPFLLPLILLFFHHFLQFLNILLYLCNVLKNKRLWNELKEYLTECLTSSTSLREINIMSIRPCIYLS